MRHGLAGRIGKTIESENVARNFINIVRKRVVLKKDPADVPNSTRNRTAQESCA